MGFDKKDFYRSLIAGGAIAILSIPIFRNLGMLGGFSKYNLFLLVVMAFFWSALIALSMALVNYIVYRITFLKWPVIFEISKYGTIGLLNTFMSAAIFNFLIIATGVEKGLTVDAFVAVSFAITTSHSFLWNRIWTFNAKGSGNHKREYSAFFAITGLVSLLNIFLMHVLINTIGSPEFLNERIWTNLAFVMLVPVSFLGNFFGYKFFVFKTETTAAKNAVMETI
ncbi:MAG: hypothetical protein COV02_01070 [Candidatus Terrybacteria bacterium CG10_big_fil_rev_8_21_14_0_10_41_10]|uniref:GtrA/DPMS transmembrane domain-containing protein n=1 Tax=Candidatus Terrybacteria bacterium CG10_big_fil_rev_8_21_14_0_10_41_10 TaxID=1975026 RepID=A0A2M8LAS2_9BACT|nr:MAG: hypothetical protein COV02_01070 [Candidatus Terrybacteria bacterium CG10_big_fil_rev_8_21_14_0_10_41_10]